MKALRIWRFDSASSHTKKLMIAGGAVFASDAVPLQSRVIDY